MNRTLFDRIRDRALELMIGSHGTIDRRAALRQAAKEIGRVEKLKTAVLPPRKPEPLSDAAAMLAMGFYIGGASRVQLIPDSEFPACYRDPVTANWRRSIEQNEGRKRS